MYNDVSNNKTLVNRIWKAVGVERLFKSRGRDTKSEIYYATSTCDDTDVLFPIKCCPKYSENEIIPVSEDITYGENLSPSKECSGESEPAISSDNEEDYKDYSNKDTQKITKRNLEMSSIACGIVTLIFVFGVFYIFRNKSGGESRLQFASSLQLHADDERTISWRPVFLNKSSRLTQKISSKVVECVMAAMKSEGIQVDSVDILDFAESTPISAVQDPFFLVTHKKKHYPNISFRTYGDPYINAAWFGSIVDEIQWLDVTKSLELRLVSNGCRTKLALLKPEKSFQKAVDQFIKDYPSKVINPDFNVRKARACDCALTGYHLTVANPSILCDCKHACNNGIKRTIIGGADNVFASKTAICPAAYYAELTSSAGGYVEAVYSGYRKIGSAQDKNISGFVMYRQSFGRSYTLKYIGFAITITPPTTTGDYNVVGFFQKATTTKSPFVEHNPARSYSKIQLDPVMAMAVYIDNPRFVSLLKANKPGVELQNLFISLAENVDELLKSSEIASLTWHIDSLDIHPSRRNGVVVKVTVASDVTRVVQLVKDREKGSRFYVKLKNSLKQPKVEMVSLRFIGDLKAALLL